MDLIWLPSSGQLDEEIIKICRKIGYWYCCEFLLTECLVSVGKNKKGKYAYTDVNPLVAKIKLLLELLESKGNNE